MKTFLLFLGLMLVVPATGQEHAPTAAQCQADAAVWGDDAMQIAYNDAQTSFVTNATPNKTEVAALGLDGVIARQNEMTACTKVDRPNYSTYLDALRFYHNVLSDRLFDFISRNNLWPEVRLEDAQGKR